MKYTKLFLSCLLHIVLIIGLVSAAYMAGMLFVMLLVALLAALPFMEIVKIAMLLLVFGFATVVLLDLYRIARIKVKLKYE